MSPEVGELDESAVDEQMQENPDEMLGMLADLTGATDPKLRDLARRLAGRLMLEIANRGRSRPRGIGRIVEQPYRSDAGDIDIDASLDALNELRHGVAPGEDGLRGWMQRLAWSNIAILNEWKRLFPDQDPVAVHERLWGVRPVCPGATISSST